MNQSDRNRRYPAARDWSTGARIVSAANSIEDGHLDLTAGAVDVPNEGLQKTDDRDLSSGGVQGCVIENGQSDDRTAGRD